MGELVSKHMPLPSPNHGTDGIMLMGYYQWLSSFMAEQPVYLCAECGTSTSHDQ